MFGLTVLLQRQGNLEEAEKRGRKVVALRTKLLGEYHADTAAAKVMFGSVLKAVQKYEEAETLLEAGLKVFDIGANKEHPEVARTLHELAELYRIRGKVDHARAAFSRAFSIRSKTLGLEHTDTTASQAALASIEQALISAPAKTA